MRQTPVEEKITALITPVLAEMGFELVLARVQSATLEIRAQDPATKNLCIGDCVKISKELSPILDVADLIKNAYRLEVSSPGFDRPLVKKGDFEDYSGKEAKIECDIPDESGQKRFRGILRGLDGDDVLMEFEGKNIKIALENIVRAKLIEQVKIKEKK